MKKIFLILLCWGLMINVYADSGGREVIFTYTDNSFSSGVKTYSSKRTVLTVSYRNSPDDLSPSQLAEILSQTSNTNAGRLYVYGAVKVIMNPVGGGTYDRLLGKTTVYQGISDPVWEDSMSVTIPKSDSAVPRAFESLVWIPVMNVYYRESTEDPWELNTHFLVEESWTLEEQLAELLGIDLSITPDGVIDVYNELYKFEALDETYVATMRFDFYDKKPGSEPVEIGTSGVYTAASLDYLGTEYLIIKYTAPSTPTASYVNSPATSGNILTKVILVTILLGILGGGSWYLKKNNLISFE